MCNDLSYRIQNEHVIHYSDLVSDQLHSIHTAIAATSPVFCIILLEFKTRKICSMGNYEYHDT